MGTKYPTNAISGYNASAPPDDGTQVAANRVDWSKVKGKIGDPLRTFVEAIEADLEEFFDYGATPIASATTITTTHNAQFCEITSAVTVTLDDAATLGDSWHVFLKNTSSGTVTIKRVSSGDTIDETAVNTVLGSMESMMLAVNAANDGFIKLQDSQSSITLGSTTPASPGTASAGVSTDAARADHVHPKQTEAFVIPVTDETTTITTGTAKVTFRMPYAFTVTAVRASLTTASSSGTPTVDINEGGTTILSTKLTIDANEKTSTTAATAAVISDSAIADDAEITIDIDVAGTNAAGLKVTIIGIQA